MQSGEASPLEDDPVASDGTWNPFGLSFEAIRCLSPGSETACPALCEADKTHECMAASGLLASFAILPDFVCDERQYAELPSLASSGSGILEDVAFAICGLLDCAYMRRGRDGQCLGFGEMPLQSAASGDRTTCG